MHLSILRFWPFWLFIKWVFRLVERKHPKYTFKWIFYSTISIKSEMFTNIHQTVSTSYLYSEGFHRGLTFTLNDFIKLFIPKNSENVFYWGCWQYFLIYEGQWFWTWLYLKGWFIMISLLSVWAKSENFNKLYKHICGVFWAETSHTHSEDTRYLFYILWKWHFTTPLIFRFVF